MGETALERISIRTLIAAVVVVFLLASGFTHHFLSFANLLDLLTNTSVTAILALGLLVVLLSGGLDISFTAVACIAQFVLAVVLANHDIGWAPSILLVAAIGLALGCFNGLIVTWLRAPPIVVTIALLNIYYGALVLISGGVMLYSFPDFFTNSIIARVAHHPISVPIAFLVATTAVTALILDASNWGRIIRATGGSRDSASRQGISVPAVNIFAYGYLGLLSGIAGLVQAQLLQAVTPGAMVGTELDVVAATVLGGASLLGGRGTVLGTLLGVLLIAIIGNSLVLSGTSPYWHEVATGLAVLASLCVQLRKRGSVLAGTT